MTGEPSEEDPNNLNVFLCEQRGNCGKVTICGQKSSYINKFVQNSLAYHSAWDEVSLLVQEDMLYMECLFPVFRNKRDHSALLTSVVSQVPLAQSNPLPRWHILGSISCYSSVERFPLQENTCTYEKISKKKPGQKYISECH